MDGVDADEAVIARPVGMQITTRGSGIGWIRVKGSDFVSFPVVEIIQKQAPAMILERVAVGQHPFAIGGVGAMAVAGEDIPCNHLGLMRLISVMIILPAMLEAI